MRKQLLLTVLALLGCCTAAWADVEINEANFPDRYFRNWVLSQEYANDGVLTDAEIASITEINVQRKNIQSLKGIEYFTALTGLYCPSNQLTALDLSQNTKLTGLWCYNNQLTALDVSKNTALERLECCQNQIKGTGMDALVKSLPTITNGEMNVISNKNEQNVMNTAQVVAAKAKGWTPYYYDDSDYKWKEYEGSRR